MRFCILRYGSERSIRACCGPVNRGVAVWQVKVYVGALDGRLIALDARDGRITTHGWRNSTEITPHELGTEMTRVGVRHALFTDVSRDGGLSGSNTAATIALGRTTGLAVIASGGVSTRDEIRLLAKSGLVAGAIIGMALYTGVLTLSETLLAAKD